MHITVSKPRAPYVCMYVCMYVFGGGGEEEEEAL